MDYMTEKETAEKWAISLHAGCRCEVLFLYINVATECQSLWGGQAFRIESTKKGIGGLKWIK